MTPNQESNDHQLEHKRSADVSILSQRWNRRRKKEKTYSHTQPGNCERKSVHDAKASRESDRRLSKTYHAAAASFEVLPNFSDASLALAISVWMVSWMLLIRMVARATGAATTAAPANEERVHTADGARRAEDTVATPLTKPIILKERGKNQRGIGVVVVQEGEGG